MTGPSPAVRTAGTGCLVLFLLPFAAVGIGTLAQAVGLAASGDWLAAAPLGLFGLVFGLVGVGGIVAAVRSGRAQAEREAVRAQHADAPWRWRPDWASGRIEDNNRGAMIAAWVFAGFWNLISFPSAFFGLRQALREQEYAALLVLIFPAIGLGLLTWAVRATLRHRRYGISRLELAAVPVPVGRELRGTILASGELDAREVALTLTCLRRIVRGSGKNRSTTERVLWQEEQRAPTSRTRTSEGMATSIPVAFRIPADAEPADETDPNNKVIWRLAVAADVPGVDYHASFEVPVFRTADSETVPEAATQTDAAPAQPFVQPPTSRVRVTRNRRGTEILFPAARNPGVAAGTTVFTAIWLAAVWALVYFDAPLLFQVIFGAIALLLVAVVLSSWFSVSRVTVSDGAVTVARGLFTPTREQRFAAHEIAEVTTTIGMQAGGTPYYDVVLVRTDGRKVPAGRSIRDKREAEWLASTVKEELKG